MKTIDISWEAADLINKIKEAISHFKDRTGITPMITVTINEQETRCGREYSVDVDIDIRLSGHPGLISKTIDE